MDPEVRLRGRLRGLPALTGDLPDVDPFAMPACPVQAFADWFDAAVEAGVPEPHAMTVSTVAADGTPSARVVLLTDVVDGGWRFATDGRSLKARDLVADDRIALTFYWQPLGRQVRVVGHARLLDPEACAADFLSRSPSSRAAALASRPGEPLLTPDVLGEAVAAARARVEREPGLVAPDWQVWSVEPTLVELWQGVSDRAHLRLVYERDGERWDRRLWSP